MSRIQHINLNKTSTSDNSKKRVQKFTLDDEASRLSYENLLNDGSKQIIKEMHAYDREGLSVITVWWIEDEFLI